ncbi:chondroitinase-B domain-containing protein [Pontiellaceae bacterium B12219]|nr:chondroitinase-B domain-containing protein [Pontiellaceae bacterium B12219]
MRTVQLTMMFLWMAGVSVATVYPVSTAAEFNALPTLNAGDQVVLQDGNYGALDKTLTSSISSDAAAQTNPVLVYAQTPGGVKITEPSNITLSGRGITLAGLDFVSGSGMIDNGSGSPAEIIRLGIDSRYMTLSNLRFKDCTTGDDYGHWIQINGFNHVVEYCSFEGKDEPNANATIGIKRSSSEAGIAVPRNHIIRRCYFGPRESSESENGYETIRIGDSSSQAHSMQVTVEENVFYRSIWRSDGEKPNDMEIISNKSADNVIRNNTFLESYGEVTLRHGDRALVEGNYFFGGGRYSGTSIVVDSPNDYQGGVRVIGTDHVVRNNYFENLRGSSYRAAICLMGGSADFDDGDGSTGDNGYEAAHNAQIFHNTFVGCGEINLGFYGSDGDMQPTNCAIYNNAWHGTGSSGAIERSNGFVVGPCGGNYIYEPGAYGWTGLVNGTYTHSVSAQITEAFDACLVPTSSSPLLNAALIPGLVSNDVRGLSRMGLLPDIGSFEREVDGTGSRPLLRSEVGPEFDSGPAGTYPVVLGALDPLVPPSGNFDLSEWYLQAPVDSTNGFSGEALTLSSAMLTNGYENAPYFYTGTDGSMVFTVPYNGAIAGTSPSPRSELRETYSDGSLRNWLPLDDGGVHTLEAVCRVNSVGIGKVAIGQIHGKEPNVPTVIMRYDGTTDPAQIAVSTYLTADGLGSKDWMYFPAPALGESIAYQMKMVASPTSFTFYCTVNGSTQSVDLSDDLANWLVSTFYFKAGAYYTVPAPGSTTQVAFQELSLSRGGDVEIATVALPNAVLGFPYSQSLQTVSGTGGPAWSIERGALPPGLSLSAGGLLSGTPTTNGVFLFTVQVLEGGIADLQSLSLAVDTAGSSMVYLSEDFEAGQTAGQQPNGATVLRPTSNTADNYVKVVDGAGNTAGAGNGVRFRDNGSASTLLSYNFVDSAGDQISAVRADFNFAQIVTGGSSSHFVGLGFGEYNTGQSLNSSANRFTEVRLYADGTIDFVASGGSSSTGNVLPTGPNSLSIFVNDYDSVAVDYTGPDESIYSLPANSVAYWLNGARVIMGDGKGCLAMDVGDSTAGGTVGSTEDNLGKFGFYSSTSYVGLDFVFDDIQVYDLSGGPMVELTSRALVGVAAGSDDGNGPENTVDGLLGTHWSAAGEGAWISYDLGVPQSLHEVLVAWYLGDARSYDFTVDVSVDGLNWARVVALETSSGSSTALQVYDFSGISARYLRIVGYGNNVNDEFAISEVEIRGVPATLPEEVVLPAMENADGGIRFSLFAVYGALYQLQRTESLTPVNWVNAAGAAVGAGDVLDLTDSDPLAGKRFYRLLVQP